MNDFNGRYVLGPDGRTPVPCKDIIEWATWFETAGEARRVAYTELEFGDRKAEVSTVFISLDHNFGDTGEPLLFETMVRWRKNGKSEGWGDEVRCSTWAEAEQQHRFVVSEIEMRAVKNNWKR